MVILWCGESKKTTTHLTLTLQEKNYACIGLTAVLGQLREENRLAGGCLHQPVNSLTLLHWSCSGLTLRDARHFYQKTQ